MQVDSLVESFLLALQKLFEVLILRVERLMQNELVVLGEVWNGRVIHLVCQNLLENLYRSDLLRGKSNELELFEGQETVEDDIGIEIIVVPLIVGKDLVKLFDEIVVVEFLVKLGLAFDVFENFVVLSGLVDGFHHINWIRLVVDGQLWI